MQGIADHVQRERRSTRTRNFCIILRDQQDQLKDLLLLACFVKQSLRSAYKRIAALKEAVEAVDGAGDADTHRCSDGRGRMDHGGIDGAKPQRARSPKVQAVIAAIDPQQRSEPSGATRKVE